MADKVTVQVLGGNPQTLDGVCNIAEVKKRLNLTNYTATVNGAAVDDEECLEDYSYVSLAPAVKGGR